MSGDDVALRVCVRRLIHGRWTSLSLSLREERRLLRVCECARRLDGRLLGPKARVGGGGRKDNSARRRDRGAAQLGGGGKRPERAARREMTGRGSMITGYHRGDHSAILRFERNRVRWIFQVSRSFQLFFREIFLSRYFLGVKETCPSNFCATIVQSRVARDQNCDRRRKKR